MQARPHVPAGPAAAPGQPARLRSLSTTITHRRITAFYISRGLSSGRSVAVDGSEYQCACEAAEDDGVVSEAASVLGDPAPASWGKA